MDSKVVRLVKEYAPEERDAAYEYYKDPQRGKRSLRKTSRDLNIPVQTLSNWNRYYGWQAQMWAEDEKEAALIDHTVKLRLVNELDGLMDHLLWLAYNAKPEHKVQADMVKHGLAIASFSAVQKVQQDITQTVEARHSVREDDRQIEDLTLDQLAERLNQKMKALTEGTEVPEGEGEEKDPALGG
jgi:hypothetical protein